MQGRRVVIAGGSEQAAQKCRLILKTEAEIVLLAPTLDPELADLNAAGRIGWRDGPITAADFEQSVLVFIATGCPGIDAALHAIAKAAGATVNVVDQHDLCDALTPSIVDRDPVVVAIGTEGTAPVLARQIKTRIEDMLEPRLGDLASLAGRLRKAAAARLSPRDRRDLWRWVFAGPVRDTHARGKEREAAQMIKAAITSGVPDQTCPAAVSLVGAGPGSRDLITLRGVQRLQEADIIFYDRLVDPGLLDLARRDAERVFVGKEPGCHDWPQDRISGVLVSAARQGKRVVRLKCGDPGVFGRGAEEAAALHAAGIEVEIVPGVTAASACAAQSGTFLTERGVVDTLVLTTGTSQDDTLPSDWIASLRPGVRMAVYMGVRNAPLIQADLAAAGLGDTVQIDIVSKAGHPDSQTARCLARDLVETLSACGATNPAILFLTLPKRAAEQGHVVAFRAG
jgi:uroporphyrin-III C-methyltransferase/precorrin-2 dehydrogenase/sirohydrochlorin ferrochelatase